MCRTHSSGNNGSGVTGEAHTQFASIAPMYSVVSVLSSYANAFCAHRATVQWKTFVTHASRVTFLWIPTTWVTTHVKQFFRALQAVSLASTTNLWWLKKKPWYYAEIQLHRQITPAATINSFIWICKWFRTQIVRFFLSCQGFTVVAARVSVLTSVCQVLIQSRGSYLWQQKTNLGFADWRSDWLSQLTEVPSLWRLQADFSASGKIGYRKCDCIKTVLSNL